VRTLSEAELLDAQAEGVGVSLELFQRPAAALHFHAQRVALGLCAEESSQCESGEHQDMNCLANESNI